jgi:hypothetical protein
LKLRISSHTLLIASMSLVCLCFAAPAMAGDIYDNGPSTLGTDAWTINSGFVVTDSFMLTSNSAATGASFIFWLIPGDMVSTLDLSIGTSAFGNDVANFTNLPRTGDTDLGTNEFGFDLRTETFSFDVALSADTVYWITLQNASTGNGDPVYWDENSGPSLAQENMFGTIPSESFTILGGETTTSTTSGNTPEPSSMLLVCSGFLGAASMVRRRITR